MAGIGRGRCRFWVDSRLSALGKAAIQLLNICSRLWRAGNGAFEGMVANNQKIANFRLTLYAAIGDNLIDPSGAQTECSWPCPWKPGSSWPRRAHHDEIRLPYQVCRA